MEGKVIFVDFDGTITQQDTCAAMVEAFARDGWQAINELWEQRIISTEECANRTFQLFDATPEELQKLLDTIEIDPDFVDFLSYCREMRYPVYILSDGYDFCIEYILKKYQIQLTYFANRLVFDQGFRIDCTYHRQECGRCGTCKRALMERLAEPESQRVYVGDGTSDLCPAEHSDLVFAKGRLLEYCRTKGIKVTPMSGFKTVLEKLQF